MSNGGIGDDFPPTNDDGDDDTAAIGPASSSSCSADTAIPLLREQVARWESQLLVPRGGDDDGDSLSLRDAEDLLVRCIKLSQVLVATVREKQNKRQDGDEQRGIVRRERERGTKGNGNIGNDDGTHNRPAILLASSNRSVMGAPTTADGGDAVGESENGPIIIDAPTSPVPIPSEVLRLIVPHLTPSEMGRLFLLTNSRIPATILGRGFVWMELCRKLWPDAVVSSAPRLGLGLGADRWMRAAALAAASGNNNSKNACDAFRWYFLQRQKPIALQQRDGGPSRPLPKPGWDPDRLTLGVDVYNDRNELVYTRTVDNLLSQIDDFVSDGTVTVHLEEPIPVGSLPRGRGCHCWNLPKSYPGWKVRLHLFAYDNNDGAGTAGANETNEKETDGGRNSFRGCRCHTLLDTGFSVWRGFSENGELTFIQKERTKGLQLSDRGRFLQHRIVAKASKAPTWRNFLGLQAKIIMVCEKTHSGNLNICDADDAENGDDPSAFDPVQHFAFTNLRIQAIRLHENAAGNVQHNLFRKDSGWRTHGVELMHLLEELV